LNDAPGEADARRRFVKPVEHGRIEIDIAGPSHGLRIGVHAHLLENGPIVTDGREYPALGEDRATGSGT